MYSGNEFSTVEGMVFKWNIEAGRTGAEILRYIVDLEKQGSFQFTPIVERQFNKPGDIFLKPLKVVFLTLFDIVRTQVDPEL